MLNKPLLDAIRLAFRRPRKQHPSIRAEVQGATRRWQTAGGKALPPFEQEFILDALQEIQALLLRLPKAHYPSRVAVTSPRLADPKAKSVYVLWLWGSPKSQNVVVVLQSHFGEGVTAQWSLNLQSADGSRRGVRKQWLLARSPLRTLQTALHMAEDLSEKLGRVH